MLLFNIPFRHKEKAMKQLQDLLQFEQFYDKIWPAQEKTSESFVWFSGIPHFLFNAVMHLSCDPSKLRHKVDELIKRAPSRCPLSFWVHPYGDQQDALVQYLKEYHFEHATTCPLMKWSVKQTSNPKYEIHLADLEAFGSIIGQAYRIEKEVEEKFTDLMKKCDAESYLLFWEGQPVNTGTLFSDKQTGAIFNIATLPTFEKRGFACAMMQFLMYRSQQLGLQEVLLLSSPAAEQFYASLGFQKIFNIEMYVR